MLTHARFVRDTLDEKGFTETESSLNEWNYGAEGHSHLEKKTMVGASYVAAVMASLQNSGTVDTAMYYVASIASSYNGLFRMEDHRLMKPYYVLCAWGDLWSLGQYHKPEMDTDTLYCCAASDGEKTGILLANRTEADQQAEIRLDGLACGQVVKFYLLDAQKDMELTRTEIFRGDTVVPVVSIPGQSVVYVTTEKE